MPTTNSAPLRRANPLTISPLRLFAAFFAFVVILALGVAAPDSASAAPTTGRATHYTATGGGSINGNCSFPALPSNGLYVAVGDSAYRAGAACGKYLDVKGPKGTVRVVVMDRCPECEPGHLDLSKTAFAKIGTLSDGIIPITYSTVVSPSVPPLSFRFKDGSSQWWFALQVLDHGSELRSVEVKVNGRWVRTKKTDYNYWIYEPGAGPGPYTVRVFDIYGRKAIVTGLKMSPSTVQKTSARLTK